MLVDMPFGGQQRKLLLHANRNGFYYVLDRATGEFLRATPFVDKLTWAKGIDAKGRPIEVPDTDPTPGGNRVCPSRAGRLQLDVAVVRSGDGPVLCADAGAVATSTPAPPKSRSR